MTSEEKVYRATELIQDSCFECVRLTADEVYQMMAKERLFDIAELISDFANFICDLTDIMESEVQNDD